RLHYVWREQTPEQIANDLDTVISRYSREWKSDGVALVGYSFGADVLPFPYNRLSEASRNKVRQISLLGFAGSADFEIHISDWFGASPSSDGQPSDTEMAKIPHQMLQCVY